MSADDTSVVPASAEDKMVDDIESEYEIGETLGVGHFSKVKLGTHKVTGEKVAIKIITKPAKNKIGMLETEVGILTNVDHPNIVRLYKISETPTTLYLVMELLTGGELFDRIIEKGHYTEEDARKVTKTLLEATFYLHEKKIAHRDLKPENILLKDGSPDAQIKITDFGLSKIFADTAAGEVVMKTACGTPGYVAPEVLTNDLYTEQVDLWSIGVIVYILLCGFPPFYGDNDAQMFKKIKEGRYKFLEPYWTPISQDAKNFVQALLVVNPGQRLNAKQALQHTWITGATVRNQPLGVRRAVTSSNLFQDIPQDAVDTQTIDVEVRNDSSRTASGRRYSSRGSFTTTEVQQIFGLPEESRLLGKFKCYMGGKGGSLFVFDEFLCFLGGNGASVRKIPLKDVEISKFKTGLNFLPGKGSSLRLRKRNGETDELTDIKGRKACVCAIKSSTKLQNVTLPLNYP